MGDADQALGSGADFQRHRDPSARQPDQREMDQDEGLRVGRSLLAIARERIVRGLLRAHEVAEPAKLDREMIEIRAARPGVGDRHLFQRAFAARDQIGVDLPVLVDPDEIVDMFNIRARLLARGRRRLKSAPRFVDELPRFRELAALGEHHRAREPQSLRGEGRGRRQFVQQFGERRAAQTQEQTNPARALDRLGRDREIIRRAGRDGSPPPIRRARRTSARPSRAARRSPDAPVVRDRRRRPRAAADVGGNPPSGFPRS